MGGRNTCMSIPLEQSKAEKMKGSDENLKIQPKLSDVKSAQIGEWSVVIVRIIGFSILLINPSNIFELYRILTHFLK